MKCHVKFKRKLPNCAIRVSVCLWVICKVWIRLFFLFLLEDRVPETLRDLYCLGSWWPVELESKSGTFCDPYLNQHASNYSHSWFDETHFRLHWPFFFLGSMGESGCSSRRAEPRTDWGHSCCIGCSGVPWGLHISLQDPAYISLAWPL